MIDISEEKKKWLRYYAHRECHLDDPKQCIKDCCKCSVFAEYKAFVHKTIPEEFRNFTIDNFTGDLGDGNSLEPTVAASAKEQVLSYGWGDKEITTRVAFMTPVEKQKRLNDTSVIAKRVKGGENIVIHGEPKRSLKDSPAADKKELVLLKMGRTFMASLLTAQALKLKADPQYRTMSFEWVSFSALLQSIKEQDDNDVHYESCGWLVIDDITENMFMGSPAQKAFVTPLLDAFFFRRLQAKLPTVLVFKFDVNRRRQEMESVFGVEVNKIIYAKNTTTICLTENAHAN
jgi:hypothetical protein